MVKSKKKKEAIVVQKNREKFKKENIKLANNKKKNKF